MRLARFARQTHPCCDMLNAVACPLRNHLKIWARKNVEVSYLASTFFNMTYLCCVAKILNALQKFKQQIALFGRKV